MKSFCGKTTYKIMFYIVNIGMIPILSNRLALVWLLSENHVATVTGKVNTEVHL